MATKKTANSVIEFYVKKYGEEYRVLITDAFGWIARREPLWGFTLDKSDFLEALISHVASPPKSEEPLVLRALSREEAKEEVASYFEEHGQAYPSDAADVLRIDSELVMNICLELVAEDRLEWLGGGRK